MSARGPLTGTEVALLEQARLYHDRTKGRQRVMAELWQEREDQDEQWGQQNHADGTGEDGVLTAKQVANLARHQCEQAFRNGGGTWWHILREEYCEAIAETDPAKLREELIQVAAVAVSWIEAIDRRLHE